MESETIFQVGSKFDYLGNRTDHKLYLRNQQSSVLDWLNIYLGSVKFCIDEHLWLLFVSRKGK